MKDTAENNGIDVEDTFQLIVNEAKKGFLGQPQSKFEVLQSQLELFEQHTLSHEMQHMHPFPCFGVLIDEATNDPITVCCLIRPSQLISSCHNLLRYADNNPIGLKFVSFYNREISSKVTRILFNRLFQSVESTQEYDLATIDIEDPLGNQLGCMGVLANARSDDFDIQSASKPIILLGLNSTKQIEYQTTLAMDVTYNYLTVFNIFNFDNIAFVNDSEFGYCVIGVTTKTTLRQTIINSINHEKIELIYQALISSETPSLPISKARKYIENKMKLQSKMIVGISQKEYEEELAHTGSIECITRINNSCFASVCTQGAIKIWNWKTGEQQALLQEPKQELQDSTESSVSLAKHLDMSGEFLLCLSERELFYFNWLTRQLEHRVAAPADVRFSCMTCLSTDVDILIGCFNGNVLLYSQCQEKKQYKLIETFFDCATMVNEETGVVKCIRQIAQYGILVGYSSGLLVCVKDSRLVYRLQCSSHSIDHLIFFEETKHVVAIHGNSFSILRIQQDKIKGEKQEGNGDKQEDEEENRMKSEGTLTLSLIQEIKVPDKINAVIALNDIELAISFNQSLQIVSIQDGTMDSFTKHSHNISNIQMLNSEGFITGDTSGKIRAWIIGFQSPLPPDASKAPSQEAEQVQVQAKKDPVGLETIDEMTEVSDEKSVQLSHRSLMNFNSSSQEALILSGEVADQSGMQNQDPDETVDVIEAEASAGEVEFEKVRKNSKRNLVINLKNISKSASANSILIEEGGEEYDDESSSPEVTLHREKERFSDSNELEEGQPSGGRNGGDDRNALVRNMMHSVKEPDISADQISKLISQEGRRASGETKNTASLLALGLDEKTFQQLKDRVDALTVQLEAQDSNQIELRSENIRMSTLIEELKVQNDSLKRENEFCQQENLRVDAEYTEKLGKIEGLKKDCDKLKLNVFEMSKKNSQFIEEKKELTRKLEEYQSNQAMSVAKAKELAYSDQKKQENMLNEMQMKLNDTLSQIKTQEEEKNNLLEKFIGLKEQEDETKSQMIEQSRELQECQKRLLDFQTEKAFAEEKVIFLERQLEETRKQQENYQEKVEQFKLDVEQSQRKEKESLQNVIASLKKDLESASQRMILSESQQKKQKEEQDSQAKEMHASFEQILKQNEDAFNITIKKYQEESEKWRISADNLEKQNKDLLFLLKKQEQKGLTRRDVQIQVNISDTTNSSGSKQQQQQQDQQMLNFERRKIQILIEQLLSLNSENENLKKQILLQQQKQLLEKEQNNSKKSIHSYQSSAQKSPAKLFATGLSSTKSTTSTTTVPANGTMNLDFNSSSQEHPNRIQRNHKETLLSETSPVSERQKNFTPHHQNKVPQQSLQFQSQQQFQFFGHRQSHSTDNNSNQLAYVSGNSYNSSLSPLKKQPQSPTAAVGGGISYHSRVNQDVRVSPTKALQRIQPNQFQTQQQLQVLQYHQHSVKGLSNENSNHFINNHVSSTRSNFVDNYQTTREGSLKGQSRSYKDLEEAALHNSKTNSTNNNNSNNNNHHNHNQGQQQFYTPVRGQNLNVSTTPTRQTEFLQSISTGATTTKAQQTTPKQIASNFHQQHQSLQSQPSQNTRQHYQPSHNRQQSQQLGVAASPSNVNWNQDPNEQINSNKYLKLNEQNNYKQATMHSNFHLTNQSNGSVLTTSESFRSSKSPSQPTTMHSPYSTKAMKGVSLQANMPLESHPIMRIIGGNQSTGFSGVGGGAAAGVNTNRNIYNNNQTNSLSRTTPKSPLNSSFQSNLNDTLHSITNKQSMKINGNSQMAFSAKKFESGAVTPNRSNRG